MKPKNELVTITDNVNLIKKLISELVLNPRLKALEWSKLTKQTPNMKIGYPGQHLASLVVGMEGTKTGARGNDIIDGSEVKSCSRVDASDTCRDCKERISRADVVCPSCGSDNIARDNTSKWLFTIRSKADLKLLTEDVKRVILVLADYPKFEMNNFEDIRFQVFEIWTNSPRCISFKELMTNYFNKIYKSHKKQDSNKTPAPKNFWPYSYQFYKCNPIKVFSCYVKNANTKPEIKIEHYVEPKADRTNLPSELMPTVVLNANELKELFKTAPKKIIEENIKDRKTYKDLQTAITEGKVSLKDVEKIMPSINEKLRTYLPLRDTDKTFTIKTKHIRK